MILHDALTFRHEGRSSEQDVPSHGTSYTPSPLYFGHSVCCARQSLRCLPYRWSNRIFQDAPRRSELCACYRWALPFHCSFCWYRAQNQSRGRKDPLANKDLLALQALPVHKVLPVRKVLPAWQAQSGRQARRAFRAPLARLDLKVR